MDQPRVLIIGTGRSGSGYIAQVMTNCGIRTGHEAFYNPTTQIKGFYGEAPVIESSWMGLPAVEDGSFKGTVFHQYRDPLSVLRSFMNGELFEPANRQYLDFCMRKSRTMWKGLRLSGVIPDTPERQLACMMDTLADWLYRCEAAATHGSYPVELVSSWRLWKIASAAGMVDWAMDWAKDPDMVLSNTPPTVNQHRPGPELDWHDLPERASKYQLEAWAKLKGYTS